MECVEHEVFLQDGDLTVVYRDPWTLQVADAYQVFDPLSQDEQHALHDDIQTRGIQVPIDVDQDGTILDGYTRVAIAKALGIPCPVIVHTYANETDKFEHAVKANLLRRHVSQIAWAQAMQRLLDAKGIERQTTRNRFTARDDTVSALYTDVGVNARTAQRRFELFDALKAYPDLVQQVDTGTTSAAAAKREARQRQGRQHFQPIKFRNASNAYRDYTRQVRCDLQKKRLLKAMSIPLIEVSYLCEDIEAFIREELQIIVCEQHKKNKVKLCANCQL